MMELIIGLTPLLLALSVAAAMGEGGDGGHEVVRALLYEYCNNR